jgi:hypothetical protein
MSTAHKPKYAQLWQLAHVCEGLLVGCATLFTFFSFSLTDPNLTFLSWGGYWSFQQWMWTTFFLHADVLTFTYGGIVSAWCVVALLYAWLLKKLQPNFAKHRKQWAPHALWL